MAARIAIFKGRSRSSHLTAASPKECACSSAETFKNSILAPLVKVEKSYLQKDIPSDLDKSINNLYSFFQLGENFPANKEVYE